MTSRAFEPASRRGLRRAARAARVGALAAVLAALGASPAAAQSIPTDKAPKADRDGDRVFDDLEQRLAPKPEAERVDVIVNLDASASAGRVRGLERRVGALAVRERFRIVDAFAARVSKRQVAALARRPGVVAVETDGRVRALNQSGSQAFGVTRARADDSSLDGDRDGNRNRYSSRDMVAAVIDTGIYAKHRDLDDGKVLAFVDCSDDSANCVRATPDDDNGHGTHVAGTLAGDGEALSDRRNRGVAPSAALVGVKVLGSDGLGSQRSVIAGIEWAVANRGRYGIEALNLSLGDDPCTDGADSMSRAANRAADAGLIVVAAAGNEGPARCTVSAPAAGSSVLAVGSMADPLHGGFFASWTSGRGALGRTVKPDVMGPGIGVSSARSGSQTGYTTKNGTSSASPFLAGVALLMRDENPSLSQAAIRTRIKRTAVDWGYAGPDIDYGWGRLDAYRALRSAGADGLDSPPQVPVHRLIRSRFETPGNGNVNKPHEIREYPIEVRNRCMPIAATLVTVPWNGYGASGGYDFDVRLFTPSGRQVALDSNGNGLGASDERQDDLSHRPTRTGTYKLRIETFKGAGRYFADVSAGLNRPPASAASSCG